MLIDSLGEVFFSLDDLQFVKRSEKLHDHLTKKKKRKVEDTLKLA